MTRHLRLMTFVIFVGIFALGWQQGVFADSFPCDDLGCAGSGYSDSGNCYGCDGCPTGFGEGFLNSVYCLNFCGGSASVGGDGTLEWCTCDTGKCGPFDN
jgi:hypothetical protein